MGGGLAFLSKKFFNPANLSNQRKVWEAEQRAEKEAKNGKERAEQLKRERDDEELAKARGGKAGGDRAALSFMYAVPPGMADERKKDDSEDAFGLQGSEDDRKPAAETSAPAGDTSCITQRQPGDDDAAAAFRAMLAGHQRSGGDGDQDMLAMPQTGPSNALVGSEYDPSADQKPPSASSAPSGDNRTQLEKAVGRRDAYNTSLTLEEQVARFPGLANAPMKPGMKADNVNVSFKPLGAEIRNVKCLKCGVWGHSKGDRECKLSGWNPFALTESLDPTVATKAAAAEVAKAQSSAGSKPEEKKPYSGGKGAYSSGSNRGSSTDSSSDTDSSEEERRRRRRKKKDRRKRSQKGSRSHHRSRHRNDDDEHRHSRKKRKHTGGTCRRRDRERSRRRDDDYTSDDATSHASHEDRQYRRKGGRSTGRSKRSRHHSRDRSRSRS